MSINERIKFIVNELESGNKAAFGRKVGISSTVVGTFWPDKPEGERISKPGFEVTEKIIAAYPQLSINWLMTGEGEPLNKYQPAGNNISGIKIKGSSNATGQYAQTGTADLQAEVERLSREVEHLSQRLKDKEELIEILKMQGKNT